MRQKIFHSVFFIVLCLAFFGGTIAAQPIIVNNQLKSKKDVAYRSNIDQTKYDKLTLPDGIEIFNPKRDKAPQREFGDADLVTVTCKIAGDEARYGDAGVMYVYNKDYPVTSFYPDYSAEVFDPSTYVCQVPVGVYDFQALAVVKIDDVRSNGIAYNVKELVNIQHDTTLVFDFSETKKYDFKYYLPDGTQAQLPVLKYNGSDWDEVPDTISYGNIKFFQVTHELILKDVGDVATFQIIGGGTLLGADPRGTYYINQLSDRYKIGSVFTFSDDESACIVKFETSDMEGTVMENNPNDYVLYQEKFTPSLANSFDGEGQVAFVYVTLLDEKYGFSVDSFETGDLGIMTNNSTTSLYIDAPKSTSEIIKYDVMVAPVFVDEIVNHTNTYGYYDEEGNFVPTFIYEWTSSEPIVGLPVLFDANGNIEYVNASHGVASGDYALLNSNPAVSDNVFMVYPGHPQFSYLPAQKMLDYGSSCPINALRNDNMEAGVWFPSKHTRFNCHYVGRYGEYRRVDRSNLQTEIRYNDEVICDDYESEGAAMEALASSGLPDGEITAHFVNRNMMVDGLQGMNVTNVYFDQRQEDWTAPTLQMLLFKDLEGNIIDRFETAEEGILEFAGGDFHPIMDEATYITWFDCKPLTVEVSYSPYSADDWSQLEVNEIPEEYLMPGFGYFYRGSLRDVTGRGEKGWFDLKIKLTDLSGNWQEQVISPAFRIGDGSLTGIEAIKSDTATEVARYTIDGRTLSAPQTGVNIVKMSDGTVKKVLVK